MATRGLISPERIEPRRQSIFNPAKNILIFPTKRGNLGRLMTLFLHSKVALRHKSDADRRWWWAIVPFILLLSKGTEEGSRPSADPRGNGLINGEKKYKKSSGTWKRYQS